MSTCKQCGAATSLNFPLCRNCWKAARTDTASAQGAEPTAGPSGSPLDVPCPYQWVFGPNDGLLCDRLKGQECLMPEYAPYIDVRIVDLGAAGKVLVHEARFQAWKSQPVKLMYEGMD